MDEPQALDAMSEDEVLAYAESCAEAARMAEVNLLRVAYQWAITHDPGRLDPATRVAAGSGEGPALRRRRHPGGV